VVPDLQDTWSKPESTQFAVAAVLPPHLFTLGSSGRAAGHRSYSPRQLQLALITDRAKQTVAQSELRSIGCAEEEHCP
jgi:hypothetical protein